MTGEKVDFQAAAEAAQENATEDRAKRERSGIDFPYVSLEGATEVARAIYARCGFGSCDQDELAAQMNQTLSGAFRMKTGAAKIFGLVEKDGRSAFRLSEIGKRIVSAETEQTGTNAGGIRFFADGSSTGGHISVLMGKREWRVNVAWLTGEIELDEKPE